MSLESGTYISDLVTTNPTGADNRSQGDDHIRLVKSTIKNSFPDVNEASMTIHNGSSAPTAKQTGTIWRDTGNSVWKFYDGTSWITLAVSFDTSNKVDINSGTIDGVTIGGSVAPTVTNLGTVTTCDIDGGSVDGVTLGTNSAVTDARIDNIKIDGNTISSTDTDGNVNVTPNGSGKVVIDGTSWPNTTGSTDQYLQSNGSGVLSWVENIADDWATKTDGIVDSTDYSSKAYAIGGTGVTDTAGKGSAKEWATSAEDDTVDGTEYSAKHYSAKASTSQDNAEASAGALAWKYTFDSTTTMADPTTGKVRFNNATLSSVTNLAFDGTTADTGNPDISDFIASIDDGTNNSHEGFVTIRKSGSPSTFAVYAVTGAITDNTGTNWLQVPVTHVASGGTFSNADTLFVSMNRSGALGATGPQGSQGIQGPAGDPDDVLTTQGDVLYRGASTSARLGAGTSGYFLKTQGTGANPVWASAGTPDDNSVTSAKIVDGAIVNADVNASASITTSKLSGAVTSIASHGLGTSATVDTGTTANKILQLDGNAKIPAVDGSQLTNLPSDVTKATSDPVITTNPSGGVGTLYLNKSSGEMWCCTDATSNENVWINIGSGSGNIQSYKYGASTTVYKAGGHGSSGTNSIEAISVSSDGSSTDISNLSVGGSAFSGHSDTPHTYGYFAGGDQGRTNQIDRFQYATTNNATDVGDLAVSGRSGNGSESTTHGYVTSGNSTAGSRTNIITKFAFGSSSSDSSVGTLTHSPESNNAGHSTESNGYQAGGHDASATLGNTINKYSHTSDGNATDIGNLTYAGYGMKGSSSTTYGYTSGGYRTGEGYHNIIDRHSFSSDGDASDWADLSRTPDSPGAGSSTTHGYNFAGHNGTTYTSDIDKFPFSSQTNATDIGNLQWGAYAPTGVSY